MKWDSSVSTGITPALLPGGNLYQHSGPHLFLFTTSALTAHFFLFTTAVSPSAHFFLFTTAVSAHFFLFTTTAVSAQFFLFTTAVSTQFFLFTTPVSVNENTVKGVIFLRTTFLTGPLKGQ